MTDMIRRQQEPANPIYILVSEHTSTCDAGEEQFHQQLSSPIRCRFNFHLLSVSLLLWDPKAIFSG